MIIEKLEKRITQQEKYFFKYRDIAYKEFVKLQNLIQQHQNAINTMKERDNAIFNYGQPQQQLKEQAPPQAPPLETPKQKGRSKKIVKMENDELNTMG